MTHQPETETPSRERAVLIHDLGTFEGFNFRQQRAIERNLTAQEVLDWDHDADGEAEFWPSGDNAGVALLFKSTVTSSELVEVDRLITELGSDSLERFLQIYHAFRIVGDSLEQLTAWSVQEHILHIFTGTNFIDLRKEAAYDLFEMYHPEEYRVWEKSHCDGLIFDTDRFLDSPVFFTEEITLGNIKALIVAPN